MMDKIERAMVFATEAHIAQKRKGSGIPYIVHPIEVMKRVSDYGVREQDYLVAALLHDVHEDSQHMSERIPKEFGQEVYDIVLECSRPERDDATKEEKYKFLCSFYQKSIVSTVIKIADRFCNVNDYMRTKGKEKYASTYALQAYPIYDSFASRVSMKGEVFIDDGVTTKILYDIVTLQTIARMVYPTADEKTIEEIKNIVI